MSKAIRGLKLRPFLDRDVELFMEGVVGVEGGGYHRGLGNKGWFSTANFNHVPIMATISGCKPKLTIYT
jgi:hypothetical protein